MVSDFGLQAHTLRLFTAMRLTGSVSPGTFLLAVGLHEAGQALALAALAAGCATLLLESDAAALRAAQRVGCSSFAVHTLDEAVRALKNEIRQRRAISVALSGGVSAHLRDAWERGLQPDLLAASRQPSPDEADLLARIAERGAAPMAGVGLHTVEGAGHPVPLGDALGGFERDFILAEDTAPDLRRRRERDGELALAIPRQGAVAAINTAWLQVAPVLFPRALNRNCWATASSG